MHTMATLAQGQDQTALTCSARSAEVCRLYVGSMFGFTRPSATWATSTNRPNHRVAVPRTPTRAFRLALSSYSRARSPSLITISLWSNCRRVVSTMESALPLPHELPKAALIDTARWLVRETMGGVPSIEGPPLAPCPPR